MISQPVYSTALKIFLPTLAYVEVRILQNLKYWTRIWSTFFVLMFSMATASGIGECEENHTTSNGEGEGSKAEEQVFRCPWGGCGLELPSLEKFK